MPGTLEVLERRTQYTGSMELLMYMWSSVQPTLKRFAKKQNLKKSTRTSHGLARAVVFGTRVSDAIFAMLPGLDAAVGSGFR